MCSDFHTATSASAIDSMQSLSYTNAPTTTPSSGTPWHRKSSVCGATGFPNGIIWAVATPCNAQERSKVKTKRIIHRIAIDYCKSFQLEITRANWPVNDAAEFRRHELSWFRSLFKIACVQHKLRAIQSWHCLCKQPIKAISRPQWR